MKRPSQATDTHAPGLTLEEARCILEKHQLGEARQVNRVKADSFSVVFDIADDQSNQYILKLRPGTGGAPLERDQYVTALLRDRTNLPVSDLSLYDGDRDVIEHDYLLLRKLPGEAGLGLFKSLGEIDQIAVMREVGHVIGTIHRQELPDQRRLDNDDLRHCRDLLETTLLGDESLIAGIRTLSVSFYPRFQELIEAASFPEVGDQPVLLWRDASLWNILLEKTGEGVQVTGIFDFQNASWGTRIFDFVYVDTGEEFHGRYSTMVFGNPEYTEEFYEGYREASGVVVALRPQERILENIVFNAKFLRYFWQSARSFPPGASDQLSDILRDLESLSAG